MTVVHRLLALCCAAVLATPAADTIPTLAIGAKAPDFDLPGVDGKNHTLAEYAAAKVLVIVFTCNHCPTAQAYEDRLLAIDTDYKGKGVTLVAINPNSNRGLRLDELGYTDVADSLPEMKIRAEHKKFTFPYLDDGDTQAVSKTYGPRVTPHAFVFDAQRALRYEGRIDDNERLSLAKVPDLRNAIDAVLAGKEIAEPRTKAAGCSTKWLDKGDAVKEWYAKVAAEPVTIELADGPALTALKANEGEKLCLINAWNTTCAPCIHELPELVTINRMYRHRGLELVTVSTNFPDEREAALKVLTTNQVAARNVLFATADKYKLMEALDPEWEGETPYTLLIAPGGKVLGRWVGTIDPLVVKRAIIDQLGRVYGK